MSICCPPVVKVGTATFHFYEVNDNEDTAILPVYNFKINRLITYMKMMKNDESKPPLPVDTFK